jgi:hypothetical protein
MAGRRAFLVGRGQTVRRIFGSLTVAVLMVLVYGGLELIDPFSQVSVFLMVWAGASGLVVLLLVLGLLDWREVGANQELERTRKHFARRWRDGDGGDGG